LVSFSHTHKHYTKVEVKDSYKTTKYYTFTVITGVKSSTVQACTIKHNGLVMYGFLSKLVCLSKRVFCDEKYTRLAYNKICPFAIHYESISFIVQALDTTAGLAI